MKKTTKRTTTKAKKTSKLVSVKIKQHKDRKGGHPHVILGDIDNKHVSVGLTRDSKKGKNSTNYKLEHNPLGGKETSYMKRQGTVDMKSMYFEERKGKMTPKDYGRAKDYGDAAKKKYIETNKKKVMTVPNTTMSISRDSAEGIVIT